jgi:hypothetical protein
MAAHFAKKRFEKLLFSFLWFFALIGYTQRPTIKELIMAAPATFDGKSAFSLFRHRQEGTRDVYELDIAQLANNRYHMVFPMVLPSRSIELGICSALEYMMFHPKDQKANDQFQMTTFTLGKDPKLPFAWCSFPKMPELRELCDRIVDAYKGAYNARSHHGTKKMRYQNLEVRLPRAENLIHFVGSNEPKETEFGRIQERFQRMGDYLQRTPLD